MMLVDVDKMELFEILAESEEDVECGRVAPLKETFDDLHKLLVDTPLA
ncbi:MAG: hypothetical protein IKH28_03925 [Lachnospiraceae bacterium]|nr:hypothetical protein [Lachnospiraceae bacterium]